MHTIPTEADKMFQGIIGFRDESRDDRRAEHFLVREAHEEGQIAMARSAQCANLSVATATRSISGCITSKSFMRDDAGDPLWTLKLQT